MNNAIDPLKVVEQQNVIIRIQSGVMEGLFLLFMQHISADKAGILPCIDRINQAAEIRAGIGLD